VAGDISRRKKVKEKRPSPFLFPDRPEYGTVSSVKNCRWRWIYAQKSTI